MTTRIIGTGAYLPERIVTNNDLTAFLDTSDEWIRERTGIGARRISTEMGTTAMAAEAAKRAIEDAGISPEELDFIILATSSADHSFPSTACEVQGMIGALNAVAFDISAACSGFIFGLHIAHGYFKAGIYKKGLIIGAETLSKVVDWNDRSNCVLFGDGAGAAVVSAGETGLIHMLQGSDGRKSWVLQADGRTLENCLTGGQPKLGFMEMDGQEVFKFAVKKVPEIVKQLLEESGTDKEDIDYFVLHQANARIIEAAVKRLRIPMEKVPMNIEQYANTSAASVPILLDEMNKKGMLHAGDKLVLAGFGAGLTWGATLIEW